MKTNGKTGVSTLINILGMSIAFATAILLMVQVRWHATYNKGFEGHEKVFLLEQKLIDKSGWAANFARPLISCLADASSNITSVATTWKLSKYVFHPESDIEASVAIDIMAADSAIFSVYPFEWVEGSAKEFCAADAAILSESVAKTLFGGESAVGKVLLDGYGGRKHIVGVVKDAQRNGSFNYGMVSNLGDTCIDDGAEWSFVALLQLDDPSAAGATEAGIEDALAPFLGEEATEDAVQELRDCVRISNLHDAHFERDLNAGSASRPVVISLAAIAILLIIIAVINFINFAFAEIPFRIKSINVRKVFGESRASLICSQLLRAALLSLIAFALALGIVHIVSGTPIAAHISGSLALGDNMGLLAVLLAVAVLSAVIAGIAPALYSTSQPAALVLKGSYSTSVKGRLFRNCLVSLQFVLSFVFIVSALFVRVQLCYMQDSDMGFDRENVLQVWIGGAAGYRKDALSDKLQQNSSIVDVTFADNLLVSTAKMGWGREGTDGSQISMDVLPVSDNFVDFFGIDIVEGRNFRPSDNESENGCFIANESFMRAFEGFYVGSLLYGHRAESEIIGVAKDFNFKPLQHSISPFVLYNWGRNPWRSFSVMYVKLAPGAKLSDVDKYIRGTVCEFDPVQEPDRINVRYLDEWIQLMYTEEQSLGKLISIASVVALLIALIGIIGLIFFETRFIRKEIAIRRVNGATVRDILSMIGRKYMLLVLISFAVASPFAYWVMSMWRSGFASQAPIPLWIFLVALVLVAAVTLLTMILQSWRAANANPVDSLKNE